MRVRETERQSEREEKERERNRQRARKRHKKMIIHNSVRMRKGLEHLVFVRESRRTPVEMISGCHGPPASVRLPDLELVSVDL